MTAEEFKGLGVGDVIGSLHGDAAVVLVARENRVTAVHAWDIEERDRSIWEVKMKAELKLPEEER
jgi:hypothetical protein